MTIMHCPKCHQKLEPRLARCKTRKCNEPTGIIIDLKNCCASPNFRSFSIEHEPKPIQLTSALAESIEHLLWYAPNLKNCRQSHESAFVSNRTYNDKLFTYILEQMGMTENDILWYPRAIPAEEVNWTETEVCVNCQKAIMKIGEETKTEVLFRHIRNMIAHGSFNIIDGMLVGTDKNRSGLTAIIKIRPELLCRAIKTFTEPNLNETVIGDIFIKLGYDVTLENAITISGKRYFFDLVVTKGSRCYAIEIKQVTGTRYLRPDLLSHFVAAVKSIPETHVVPVLLIDSSVLTLEAKDYLARNNVLVLDRSRLGEMILGKDVLKKL